MGRSERERQRRKDYINACSLSAGLVSTVFMAVDWFVPGQHFALFCVASLALGWIPGFLYIRREHRILDTIEKMNP